MSSMKFTIETLERRRVRVELYERFGAFGPRPRALTVGLTFGWGGRAEKRQARCDVLAAASHFYARACVHAGISDACSLSGAYLGGAAIPVSIGNDKFAHQFAHEVI